MSSIVDSAPAHIQSQETRDPASVEVQNQYNISKESIEEKPRSKLASSKSELKLPQIRSKGGSMASSANMKPYDRLYYENKDAHKYGKRTEMLAEIASHVYEPPTIRELKANAERSKSPSQRDPFKKSRNIPIHEAIGSLLG